MALAAFVRALTTKMLLLQKNEIKESREAFRERE
jgi:hypothetical protein